MVHGGTRFAARSLAAQAATAADAFAVPVVGMSAVQWESVAASVEDGKQVWVTLPREHPRRGGPDIDKLVRAVLDPWRGVGLPASGLDGLVVHTDTSGAGNHAVSNMQGVAYETRTAIRVAAGLAEVAAA